MGLEVKCVTIINGVDTIRYSIGDKINKKEIAKITDSSLEFDDSYASIYLIYDKDEKLIKSIENCPVDVTFI